MTVLLYNQSCYSLLNSTLTIRQLTDFCVEAGYKSVGLADKNVMYGALEFYKACISKNIKPLFGLELNVRFDESDYPFLVYARNNEGYKKLMKLSSYLCTKFNYLKYEDLLKYKKYFVLIAINSDGYLEKYLNLCDENKAKEIITDYKNNDIYVGLAANNSEFNKKINNQFAIYNDEINAKTVALPKSLYCHQQDYYSYQITKAIENGVGINDVKTNINEKCELKNDNEMNYLFEAKDLENSDVIAKECNVDLNIKHASLPKFNNGTRVDSKTYLTRLCEAGLNKRLNGHLRKEYIDRLKDELDVIKQMNFEDYFLIVWDIIRFERNAGIFVGPGRGSAAGSLVAYCLGISHVDPIRNNLLFERFLNKERVSMPDIDMDIPDNDRNKVINYVRNKYGEDHVANIITFNTLGPRAALRDVGKVLNISSAKVDMLISIMNKRDSKSTLKQHYDTNPNFKKAIDASDEYRTLFDNAVKIEGLPRHISVHASGVIISDITLTDIVPLTTNSSLSLTQYGGEYLEELGLLKMDFLGLRNLSIIQEVIKEIKKFNPDFDIYKIGVNDRKVFDLLKAGKTSGIIQLETESMTNLIKRIKPVCFNDIVVTNALNRPGASGNINTYLAARENKANIKYLHNDLIPILRETDGIILYQEQSMMIARKFAGFSLNKADILRKAMAKKNSETMAKLRDEFVSGTVNNGYDKQLALDLFALIEKFADYGFNKSHSVAYGLLAYQMAYCKTYYPLIFYKALLNGSLGSTKMQQYILECRQNNINLLIADINNSTNEYTIEKNGLRFPLTAIKSINTLLVNSIMEERNRNGRYTDFFNAITRLYALNINKQHLETLIKAGCFDSFKLTRNSLLDGLEPTLRYAKLSSRNVDGQISFNFDLVSQPRLINIVDSKYDNFNYELEYYGLYLSAHPCSSFRKDYPKAVNSALAFKKAGNVELIVMVTKTKEHITKTNQEMLFIDGNDETGEVSLLLMPKQYSQFKDIIKKNIIILVDGKVSDGNKIIVNYLKVLKEGI